MKYLQQFVSRPLTGLAGLICCLLTASLSQPCLAEKSAEQNKKKGTAFECVGSYGETINSFVQASHYVFLNQGYTVRVLDIADPAKPVEIAWLRCNEEVDSIAVKWPALYASGQIFDISDPAHPRRTNSVIGKNFRLMGNFLKTEGHEGRLVDYSVFNIKDPLKPIERISGEWSHGGQVEGFGKYVTDGSRLFEAKRKDEDADNGQLVEINDVTTSPVKLGDHTVPEGAALTFAIKDGKLIASDTETTLTTPLAKISPEATVWVYSTEEGTSILQEGQSAPSEKITVTGNEKHNGNDNDENKDKGLKIFENTGGTSPTLHGVYGEHPGARQFKLAGRRGYLIDGDGGLQILDITDPTRPRCLARHAGFSEPVIRAVDDDLIFIGDKEPGFRIFNCANPTSPTLCGQYAGASGPMSLQGRRAYVAAGKDGLQILDISNLANIRPLGHYTTPNPALDLVTSGTLVYLLAKDLLVVNAANPAQPVLVGSTPLNQEDEESERSDEETTPILKRLGPVLYSIKFFHVGHQRGSSCTIIDVSNPIQPRLLPNPIIVESLGVDDESSSDSKLGSTLNPAPTAPSSYTGWFLGLPSSYFHTGSWESNYYPEYTIFDLTDPLKPYLLTNYTSTQSADHVVFSKDTLYLADGSGGLLVLRPKKH